MLFWYWINYFNNGLLINYFDRIVACYILRLICQASQAKRTISSFLSFFSYSRITRSLATFVSFWTPWWPLASSNVCVSRPRFRSASILREAVQGHAKRELWDKTVSPTKAAPYKWTFFQYPSHLIGTIDKVQSTVWHSWPMMFLL